MDYITCRLQSSLGDIPPIMSHSTGYILYTIFPCQRLTPSPICQRRIGSKNSMYSAIRSAGRTWKRRWTQNFVKFCGSVSLNGLLSKFISLIEYLYGNSGGRFRPFDTVSLECTTSSGIREGGPFSHFPFDFVIEMVVKIVLSPGDNSDTS